MLTGCLLGLSLAQLTDSKQAKILKEQRFNAGDGRFGSAFAAEDGTVFREETGADGERIGQYSYIGEDGDIITVKYSAGRGGFRILEGNHVPEGASGQNSAAHDPSYREPAQQQQQQQYQQPQQQRQYQQPQQKQYQQPQQQQQYQQPQQKQYQQPQQQQYAQQQYNYATEAPGANINPFINPDDPSHRDLRYNINAASYQQPGLSQQQQQPSVDSVPDCADCAGTNPFINPYDPSHQPGYVQPQQPAARPVQQQQQQQQQQQIYNNYVTEQPRANFFPSGKLNLNRFETGFNFDFES